MRPKFDVLALGAVAVDDLFYIDSYPAPDEKMPILRRQRQCGGMSAIAAIAASRLGCRTAYGGVLGRDELSEFAIGQMRREGVNLRHLAQRDGVRPVHSIIMIDSKTGTRNIFYDLQGVLGAARDWPAEEVIRSTRVLFVDWYSISGMIRAARLARAAGIPVVADFEQDGLPGFATLLALADHLILSQGFAAKLTGLSDPRRAVVRLWTGQQELAAVTCGAKGCYYVTSDKPGVPRHQPAFKVQAVDTTGCGDVFHGAYAAALARGMSAPDRIRFAAAAAALKATQSGGAQGGIPTLAQTLRLIRQTS
ncbi:MAG TPA: PfkB family carbohydrate kinase [Candidatus Cybelea sp.]|jgi:sulfofructose kinase|nr:PfkB family carbohydrate kinase [Candidatus Cybelea sp.]